MASSYRIDIGGLLSGGRQRLVLDQQIEIEPFEGVCFPGPAAVHLEMHSAGDMLEIAGTVDARFHCECNRCLGEVDRALHVVVDEQIDAAADAQKDPFSPSNVLTDDRLDVKDLTKQLVFSAVPLNVLCEAGCKGMCSICGQNKNTGVCACVTETE